MSTDLRGASGSYKRNALEHGRCLSEGLVKVAFASSPGEAVIRFQIFACLWLKDFVVSLALILSHLQENV